MKLDSIVYDIPTLANALTEQLQLDSPTFKALYPSETATSLVNVMAGYGSMLQYMVVSSIANCFTDSAFSPSGIYQLAETLGNRLHGNISSTVVCDLVKETCKTSSTIIPSGSTFTVEGKPFFNPSSISFGIGANKVRNVLLVQGTKVDVDKITTGVSDEKIYFGNDFKVNPDYITVKVNGEEWEVVESLISYDIYSILNPDELKVVVFRTDSDGRCYIKFGNGINGLVPASGSTVSISYVINDGEEGNILQNNLEVTLITPLYYNQEQLVISASATSTAYGGSNQQSLVTLKESSPYVFASGDRCVRRNDYKAVLLNKCGYLTCNVWGEYEQALSKGTYDKSMMNMVYYTGIKSFRHVDSFELGRLSYDNVDLDSGIYTWRGSLSTTRALPGSVTISIENTEEPETPIYLTDEGGQGILFNNDDLQFDSDDLLDDYMNGYVSLTVPSGGENGLNTIDNIIYNLPNSTAESYYESTEFASRQEPIQISFNYLIPQKARALAGIKFYTPKGDNRFLKNSIGAFAIYGTNESNPSYTNIANNSDWVEVIPNTILNPGNPGEWSHWVASNLYRNGEGANILSRSTDPLEDSIVYYRDASNDSLVNSSYAWTNSSKTKTVYTSTERPNSASELNDEELGDNIYSTSDLSVVVATVQRYTNWASFTHYVIEVYSVNNNSVDTLKLGKIKLLYAETDRNGSRVTEVSTIDYDDNGAVTLNIPNVSTLFNQLYSYDVVLKNITNIRLGGNYRTGDLLMYPYHTSAYCYQVGAIVNSGRDYIVGDIVSFSDGTSSVKYKITRVDPATGEVQEGELIDKVGNFDLLPAGDTGYEAVLRSRPASVLTVSTNPQSSEVVLDSRSYVVTSSNYIYYRSSSLDRTEGGVDYTAWTTRDTTTDIETLYAVRPSDPEEDLVQVGDILYKYSEDSQAMIDSDNTVLRYQPPLREPSGLRVEITTQPIVYKYYIKLLGELSTSTPENVQFATEVNVSVEGVPIEEPGYEDYYGRFPVTIEEGALIGPLDEEEVGPVLGGKISVTSTEALKVSASYYGNRISEEEVARIDSNIIEKYNHFTTYLEYVQPSIVQTRITARVNYKDSINVTKVKQDIAEAVFALFEVKPYSMGSTLYLSDVYNAIHDVEGVNYVLIDSPNANITVEKNQLLVLSELELLDEI